MSPESKTLRVVETLSPEQHKAIADLVTANTLPPTPDGCLLLRHITGPFSLNSKKYVQIKVPKLNNPKTNANSKVQLHQFIAWNSQDTSLRNASKMKLEISHRCQFKHCANPQHLTAETSYKNKCRWTCPCIVMVNGKERLNCLHGPAHCIPGPWARKHMFEY